MTRPLHSFYVHPVPKDDITNFGGGDVNLFRDMSMVPNAIVSDTIMIGSSNIGAFRRSFSRGFLWVFRRINRFSNECDAVVTFVTHFHANTLSNLFSHINH